MKAPYVICLGRQLGSGGKEIGEKLAKALGIAFYDKELLALASEESGLGKEFFEQADERAGKSLIGGLFGTRFPFVSDGVNPLGNCLSHDALFQAQSEVIRRVAEQQSCLFVGRCADYILRDHPRCLSVFISAPTADRIARLKALHGITDRQAEALIEKTDRQRSAYYNYYSYKTWGAASTYQLCVDSSVLGIDATVAFIRSFVEQRLGEEG
jgi:cytidylate kinase